MTGIYNSTDGPIVVDTDGRVLGGREHGNVSSLDVVTDAGHVAARRIIVAADPVEQADPEQADEAPEAPAPKRTRKGSASTTTQEA